MHPHVSIGPAYEGGIHLLSLAAFPSTKNTQVVLIRAESTQKQSFWMLMTILWILYPDGIWTHAFRIRSLAC